MMDSQGEGAYRDHNISETNWGFEFYDPAKCISFVAANQDTKNFRVILFSE